MNRPGITITSASFRGGYLDYSEHGPLGLRPSSRHPLRFISTPTLRGRSFLDEMVAAERAAEPAEARRAAVERVAAKYATRRDDCGAPAAETSFGTAGRAAVVLI